MEDKYMVQLSRKCYYACIIVSALFLIVWCILQVLDISLVGISPRPCVWYTAFHVYCPGCGGTRAVVSMMQGDFVRSFLYHPAVLFSVGLVLVYMISHTFNIVTRGKVKAMLFRGIYLYSILAVIVVQCIIKNAFVVIGNGYPYA